MSKRGEKFLPLDVRPPLVAATLLNEAGIVGSAVRARELLAKRRLRAGEAS